MGCWGYCGLVLWLLTSFIVTCALVAVHHNLLRTLFYLPCACKVQNVVYPTQYRCDCGSHCQALYPCLVGYAVLNCTDIPEDGRIYPIRTYHDDWQYLNVAFGDPDRVEQCYYHICGPNSNDNRDFIERIRILNMTIGSSFLCYYDYTEPMRGAFRYRHVSWQVPFHILFWPGCSLFLSTLITCCLCCRLRTRRYNDYVIADRKANRLPVNLEKY